MISRYLKTIWSLVVLTMVFAGARPVAAQGSILLPRGSTWRYNNLNKDLFGSGWEAPAYNDASWTNGAAPLGYNFENNVQFCTTVIEVGQSFAAKFPVVYYRTTFDVVGASGYQSLILRVQRDDGAVIFLNGVEVLNDAGVGAGAEHVPEPLTFNYSGTTALGMPDETNYFQSTISAAGLREGANVIAVANYQAGATSSDLQFDLEIEGVIDTTPPVATYDPAPGSSVQTLTLINAVFSEPVVGVNASDLLIDGQPATSVVTNNNNDYTFSFPQPPTGVVQVAWAPNHGITDTATTPNPFAGGNWSYRLDTNVSSTANFIISEFLANNSTGIRDEDGNHSDWIELENSGSVQGILDGWYLTDTPTNLTKWQFPAGVPPLQPNSFLIVFASAKDRTNALSPLHTNFKLSSTAGSYLALVDPNSNVVSAFISYPAQQADVSYGRDAVDPTVVGYFTTPTPGKLNSTSGSGFVPEPIFSIDSGIYTNDSLSLSITVSNAPPGTTIRYTINGSIPTNSSSGLAYTGPITLTTNILIKARAFPPAGTNLFASPVIAKDYIFLDDTTKNFSSNLPLMIIDTHGVDIPQNIPPGGFRPEGGFVVIDTDHGRSSFRLTPQFHGEAGFELFGQTSTIFPNETRVTKPPVRIEVHDSLANDLHVSLLGLPADSDFKLRNPWDDKTFLNDFLGFELFEKMGHYSVRRRFVETFVKTTTTGRLKYPDDYVGIETMVETIKIDKNRVDVPTLTPFDTTAPAITGGYIFKKDKDSTGDINFSTAGGNGFPGEALKIHEPKVNDLRVTPGVTTSWPGPGYTTFGSNALTYLIGYLNQMEHALYATNWTNLAFIGTTNHYSYYMDLDRFVDFFWVVEFSKQIDGIRLSSYFTKERGFTNELGQWVNGKVGPGPVWDWNLSFGNANYLRGGTTNGWYYSEQDQGIGANEDIWLRRLVNGDVNMGSDLVPDQSGNTLGSGGDPDFDQMIVDRWAVLRLDVCNGTNMLQEIDQLSTTLSEAAGRDYTAPRLFSTTASKTRLGVYTWPNPSGANNVNERDVDYVHPTNYLGNVTNSIIGQMKRWMMGRYLWLDAQFTHQPTFSAPDGMVTNGFMVTVTPPPGATLYYTLDGSDPRAAGGGVNPGVLSNTGPATLTITSNVRIFARAKAPNVWYHTWSAPSAVSLFTVTPSLRITEIMYHPFPPPPGSIFSTEDFEYIEVKNIGSTPLSVNRFSLGGGINFQFPNIVLSAGQRAVVVANIPAFQSRYGTNNPNILILGAYTGHLNNAGDHVALYGNLQENILDFSFSDSWYPATDGFGFSLVTVNDNAATSAWGSAGNWRPSSALFGSPGVDDPAPPARPAVVVNEVLSHETLGTAEDDAIELLNTTGGPADVSGWFLTDDFNTPQKFVIPPGTIIPAGGYLVYSASNSFAANGLNSFRLGAEGDQVYLFSGDGVNLTGYAQGYDFGAAPAGRTFGRYLISTGADHFVAQRSNTLGKANSGPLVGPIVISEINYHPPDVANNNIGFNNFADEYIELQNITANAVALYDTSFPSNSWHLRDAVEYEFPSGTSLPAGGFLLVVSFDPAADATATATFRSHNFVPDSVPLYGPWIHSLDNGGASVELARPDVPTTNGVAYILVDRVKYSDSSPWPAAADGFGLTLQRVVPSSYGDDPTNWVAVAPSPGGNYVPGSVPPAITSQPGNLLVVAGTDVIVSASATGTAPVRYQWRFNGLNLAGANSSTLTLTNFQFTQAGTYNIFVYNYGGSALGTDFNIIARLGLKITTQPVSRLVQTNQNATFSLAAVGSGTLGYQWRFNGANIPNATNSLLSLTNVQLTAQGTYDCVVTDPWGAVYGTSGVDTTTSQPVTLTIVYRPTFTQHPLSQTVVAGRSVTFSASGVGTTPLSFRWRKVGATLTNGSPGVYRIFSASTYSFITLTNVGLSDGTNYTVVITNVAGTALGGPQPGLSSNALLTVLADADGDGLPDIFETGRPGFDPNNPADGARDDDGDGMKNADEYFAGTDPLDPTSNLKGLLTGPASGTVQFMAVSNRTYTVQFTDSQSPLQWQKLADILATGTTHPATVVDPNPRTNRLYRIVTPAQP